MVIAWRGESAIDGGPIMVAITSLLYSKNRKTGSIPQIWIVRSDKGALDAIRDGSDYSICGDCKFCSTKLGDDAFRFANRKCYVRGYQLIGVTTHMATAKEISLEDAARLLAMHTTRTVRIGAYGDPAAVPYEVWEKLLSKVKHVIGYTHQWKTCDQRFNRLVMASCDTPIEVALSNAKGYRVFLVEHPGDDLSDMKLLRCPASKEAGRKLTCAQ